MGKSRKGGLNIRRKSALHLLEFQYEAFKKAGVDKEAWETTRNGRKKVHNGSKFNVECSRFQKEIALLKSKIR